MPKQKNQHYVPKFYQRLFSVDGNTIGVYIPEQGKKIDSANIKFQASEDYLYTNETENEDNIESAIGSLEGEAKIVIEKLLQDSPAELTREEEYVLYVFVLLQLGRTLNEMETLQMTADKMVQQILRVENRFHNNKEGDAISDDFIDNVKMKFANLGAFSVVAYLQLIPLCIDVMREYKVLINRTKKSFVTSDNPACLYNMFLEKCGISNGGAGCRGIMFYLPLSADRAVLYYDSKVYKCGFKKRKEIEITNEQDVEELNKLTAVNSRKLFLFNSSRTRRVELEKMAAQMAHYKNKTPVEEISGVNMESGKNIIGTHRFGNCCNLKLSFVKYLPLYNAITAETFNPQTDMFREIAYYKDELEKRFMEDIENKKKN